MRLNLHYLWAKWILDETKPTYTIDLVPAYWRDEVEALIKQAEQNKKG